MARVIAREKIYGPETTSDSEHFCGSRKRDVGAQGTEYSF